MSSVKAAPNPLVYFTQKLSTFLIRTCKKSIEIIPFAVQIVRLGRVIFLKYHPSLFLCR